MWLSSIIKDTLTQEITSILPINFLLFQVMIQPHNRQMSFSLYISALAVSDTMAVLICKSNIHFIMFYYHLHSKECFKAMLLHMSVCSQRGYPCSPFLSGQGFPFPPPNPSMTGSTPSSARTESTTSLDRMESACYLADGMSLLIMQEDCLVLPNKYRTNILSNLLL